MQGYCLTGVPFSRASHALSVVDVRNNLLYLDENSIMYPAGHNVAIYRIEQRDQTFIYSATHPFVSEGEWADIQTCVWMR